MESKPSTLLESIFQPNLGFKKKKPSYSRIFRTKEPGYEVAFLAEHLSSTCHIAKYTLVTF